MPVDARTQAAHRAEATQLLEPHRTSRAADSRSQLLRALLPVQKPRRPPGAPPDAAAKRARNRELCCSSVPGWCGPKRRWFSGEAISNITIAERSFGRVTKATKTVVGEIMLRWWHSGWCITTRASTLVEIHAGNDKFVPRAGNVKNCKKVRNVRNLQNIDFGADAW